MLFFYKMYNQMVPRPQIRMFPGIALLKNKNFKVSKFQSFEVPTFRNFKVAKFQTSKFQIFLLLIPNCQNMWSTQFPNLQKTNLAFPKVMFLKTVWSFLDFLKYPGVSKDE